MADFYVDESGNVTTKKKKKKKSADYYVDEGGKITAGAKEDIAPVRNNYDHLTTKEEIQTELKKQKKDTGFWDDIGVNLKAFFIGLGDEEESKKILDEHKQKEAEVDALARKLEEVSAKERQAEFYKKYGGISQNADFTEKSVYQSTKKDGIFAKFGSEYALPYKDVTYEYINNTDGVRSGVDAYVAMQNSYNRFLGTGYDRLTDDEIKIYNYLYATSGKEEAEEFLEGLADALHYREAQALYAEVEGNTATEILMGLPIGVDQFASGIKGLGNMLTGDDEYVAPSSLQMAGGMIREDLAENTSVGQFAYDVVNTGANMIPSIAASTAVGMVNPAAGAAVGAVTMGGSAGGNAYQTAINNGYDADTARAYGTSIGVLEGSLQYALGGIGKLGGTSKYLSKAISGIDNGLLRFAAEFGSQIGSEALEEGLQEILDPLVQKAVMGKDEDINWEEVAYSAMLGGFMGGASGAVGATVNATSNAIQNATLSESEKSVVDKIVEDAVAKREENGETLSKKDKNKIYDSVVEQMEKGQLDVGVIDEMFGGDSYSSYRNEVKGFVESDTYREYKKGLEDDAALTKEIEELGKKENATPADNFRYSELMQKQKDSSIKQAERRAQIDEGVKKISEMRSNFRKEIIDKLGDSKLVESYREEARSHQKFKADPTKYKGEYAQKTIQAFVDSGLANDTNAFHEIADWLADMSEQKGVVFNLTDKQALKGTRFEHKGKTTNAYLNEETGDIVLNIDSSKPLNSSVGHELGHVLKGIDANLYEEFKANFKEWANKRNGEWDARYKATEEAYAKRGEDGNIIRDEDGNIVFINNSVNVSDEVLNDLIGDYIFTDKDFVKHLSVKQPNVFERIWDEIKFMVKCAKAGTEVEKELIRLEKQFAEIWRETGKYQPKTSEATETAADTTTENVQFSIREEAPPKETGIAYKVFFVKDGKLYPPMVANPDGADTPMGVWLNADVGTSAPPSKTGRAQVKAGGKGTQGGSGSLAFRPGWHLGDLPRASQFDRVNPETGKKELFPENFVWAEVEYAKDVDYQEEAMSYGYTENGKFRHAYAGLPKLPENGYYRYRTNPKPDTVPWIITGAMKVNRLLSDAEVNEILEKNGVAPVHRRGGDVGLEKFGIDEGAEQIAEDVKVLEGGTAVKYSLSTWTPETQSEVRDNLVKVGYETERVDKWISDLNSVAAVIASDKDRLDFEAADNQVMLKNNQEYVKTLDSSTLCDKRLPYQGTFNEIQHRLPDTVFTSDDLIELRNLMVERGYKSPCAVCYVESRRRHLGKFAQEWLDGYEGEYKPRLDELTTSDGLEDLRHRHPETYKAFVDAMNAKGSANPKVVQLRTAYQNDIMKLTPKQIEKILAIGGLRVQSFSDFETPHLLDMMQAVLDMATKGLTSQAYTKVPNFAWVFGDTGIKINLSLIAEGDGFDADGNLAFSSVEGMDINDAMALRDAYSENVGTIIVGANDAHILACMADERIDYIIPFHRSGWGKNEMDMMGLGSYKDYSYGQNEHSLETGKKVDNLYPPDYWDYNLNGKENAERYLSLCARTGREPKFSEFLVNNGDGTYSLQPDGSTDGYWKTLIDFKMYDNEGNGAAQQKVQPNFNMEEAYRVLDEYEGGANSLPVANDVVEEFVAKHRDNIAPTQHSLSNEGESYAPIGNFRVYGKDIAYTPSMDDVAPTPENVGEAPMQSEVDAPFPDEISPMTEEEANAIQDEKVNAHSATMVEALQAEIANLKELRDESFASFEQKIAKKQAELKAKKNTDTKTANNLKMQIERLKRLRDSIDADYAKRIGTAETREKLAREGKPTTRQELQNNIINDIKATFNSNGYELDDVLDKAKDLSTFQTVDNTPQRVLEKALGYKEGQILSDITVNKIAQNETEGIKWLNSYLDKKEGEVVKISKQYRIRPGSKESAAAQMYAEGFYVGENNDIIAYGDAELAQDFPNEGVQYRIKGLAADPRIRQIYDETLDALNESRKRNAYPEIPRLDNYFLHFRAMDDTFSRLGLPFNPNDIRAKDLPTDLNGVTADLKPGQPYFASAMHRKGKRTSFDLLGGLERYLTSAKNQIYHIDDIQTLRALRNYIADTYGQANGLEGIDALSEEEAQERIEKVYNSHLSTFAKFLNEEANVLAGKTALIDRGLEGIIGRRGITFLDTVNKQVGSNLVGYSASSAIVNLDAIPRAIAKTNKFDFLKGFSQFTANKITSIFGKNDGFAENSPVIIRRKGAERFHRTFFQKLSDGGYVLMGVVDDISTEIIARAKYNELTRKGMDEQTAHFETDKWVSKLMGDRSLGQQPLIFNSKMLGLVTKFQLEVRNNLDSQFYDTIQESKVSSEHIENALARNAATAAKITSTFVQLAVAQHLFGKAFEAIAGYNPSFDIISVIATMFGFDDDEESEDTVLDNLEQGFLELLEDLPYTSTFTGGRIPVSNALPIKEFVTGKDSYGNDKSRWETFGEAAPYYVLPGGYGQIKKTRQGLNMFSDEHPVSGSYTDSGNLRFPVEDTLGNRVQAALFGQYASENAREYFDNGYAPLQEKQIQEYIDVDIPIKDYREYREGLSDIAPLPGNKSVTLNQKGDYIGSLDLPTSKKNILINNIADRNTPIDMSSYDDYADFEEFDFAQRYPEKYAVLRDQGISVSDYNNNLAESAFMYTDDYAWAADNPELYALSKVISDDVTEYKQYASDLNKFKGDNKKQDKWNYIFNLDIDYGAKCVLFKYQYPKDETYAQDAVDYILSRYDLTYDEQVAILEKIGFKIVNGQVKDAD